MTTSDSTLSPKTLKAVAKYGRAFCIKAHELNRTLGPRGAIAAGSPIRTISQALAAIAAGRELLGVTAANLAAINARAKDSLPTV
jgi:hypothetical protein